MPARAITPGQTVEEVITDEAGEVDLSSELLREKMAALFNGRPDEWGGPAPRLEVSRPLVDLVKPGALAPQVLAYRASRIALAGPVAVPDAPAAGAADVA